MRRIVYRPAALADLDAIFERITQNNPQRAFTYVEDIRARCRRLIAHPELGPARDWISPGLRIHPMFRRVVVCYRIEDATVVVLRVFYGGRDYGAIMSETNNGRL